MDAKKTLKVRAAKPGVPVPKWPIETPRQYIGDDVAEVPDIRYYRQRIKAGDLTTTMKKAEEK